MRSKEKSDRKTILLVDDERELLEILSQVLETKGYEVVSASTPETALLVARNLKRPIDLLIADMLLPGMSGSELAGNIAVSQPGMARLFISGEPTPPAHIETAHYLAKPFSVEEISDRIDDLLSPEPNQ